MVQDRMAVKAMKRHVNLPFVWMLVSMNLPEEEKRQKAHDLSEKPKAIPEDPGWPGVI
jgi:hypothetical protein